MSGLDSVQSLAHALPTSQPEESVVGSVVRQLVNSVRDMAQNAAQSLAAAASAVENAAGSVQPSERKLAQVVRIAEVVPIVVPKKQVKDADGILVDEEGPIEYANSVELVILEDPIWQCVAKKEEHFKPGHLAIYFSIDSVLDKTNPAFSFLEGKRLKTKKFLGQLSQGMVVPLDSVKYYGGDPAVLKVGDDLTELFKVEKYLFKGDEAGQSKLPPGVRKTHENRVQECSRLIRDLADSETLVTVTRKEDGTSTSYVLLDGEFYVCGHRTIRGAGEKGAEHYFEVAKRFNVEKNMRALGRNLAVQGEIVGVKINGNTLKFPKGTPNDFRCFYIWDIDHQRKLTYDETDVLCKQWGLNRPPLLYRGVFKKEWVMVKALLAFVETLEYSEGVPAEGAVWSTDGGIEVPQQGFKVISDLWLLKTGR